MSLIPCKGTRSLPVKNKRNFFLSSIESSWKVSQNHLEINFYITYYLFINILRFTKIYHCVWLIMKSRSVIIEENWLIKPTIDYIDDKNTFLFIGSRLSTTCLMLTNERTHMCVPWFLNRLASELYIGI